MSVIVHVRLFATLRRHYPHLGIGESMAVELTDGTTIEQLIEHLHLPAAEITTVFVNSAIQKWKYTLNDGDQVGIFPPVGGG